MTQPTMSMFASKEECLEAMVNYQAAEIERLKAELAECREDAERYRGLCD